MGFVNLVPAIMLVLIAGFIVISVIANSIKKPKPIRFNMKSAIDGLTMYLGRQDTHLVLCIQFPDHIKVDREKLARCVEFTNKENSQQIMTRFWVDKTQNRIYLDAPGEFNEDTEIQISSLGEISASSWFFQGLQAVLRYKGSEDINAKVSK